MKKFPTGRYGRHKMEFFPAPFRAPLRAFAGLVFPWDDGKVVICDISDRGWSIPSGRVEPNETSLQAVMRESVEEAGAVLKDLQYIGCYRISERTEVRWADVYAARVQEWVEIGMQDESRGRQVVSLEELPEIYHLWTPLTEAVFKHSFEVLLRMEQHGG